VRRSRRRRRKTLEYRSEESSMGTGLLFQVMTSAP